MRYLIAHSFAALIAALIFIPVANADTWHAAPGGSGTDCTAEAPCSANYATATKALDDDTVVFAGGDYAIATGLNPANWISIEGATTGVPTRLVGGAGVTTTLSFNTAGTLSPAHITDLHVTNQVAAGYALSAASSSGIAGLLIDRVLAEASGTNANALVATQGSPSSGLLVRNSIGRTTGTGGNAVSIRGPVTDTGEAEVRNVIADSRGSGGIGLRVAGGSDATNCGIFNVVVKNSIARSAAGASSDLEFTPGFGAVPCDASLTSHNSNWRGSNAPLEIVSINDQHDVNPAFADAAAGDYHQLAGSPTIDAGVNDASIGPKDLGNAARVQGAAPDIGAYEFAVTPPPVAEPDTAAPIGSNLRLSPKNFRAKAGKTASISAKKKPRGTTASFALTESATVSFTVQKKSTGRKKGNSCSSRRKTGKKCTIYKNLKGSFSRASTLGANSFKFTGYLNGKALKPGSYRLVGAPTDAAGNTGAVFMASFAILAK